MPPVSAPETHPEALCANCPYFRPSSVAGAAAKTDNVHAIDVARGLCRRYPQSTTKSPNEQCGEHPTFAAMRDHAMAKRVAALVASVDRQVSAASGVDSAQVAKGPGALSFGPGKKRSLFRR